MIEPSTSKLFSLFVDRGFWQRLVPDMSIEDNHGLGGVEPWKLPFPDEAGFQGLLDREGYVQMSRVVEPALAGQLSTTIAKLASLGIPPIFAMVFDAFWAPVFRLDPILKAAFGATYGILPNLWVWHIDPAASESGWRPHREIGHEALFADRRPKSLSAWIALTAATPLNGCMYVVPADRDPTYGTGDDDKHLFGLSEVRALPADAGDVFLWNQAILHWGAHASPRRITADEHGLRVRSRRRQPSRRARRSARRLSPLRRPAETHRTATVAVLPYVRLATGAGKVGTFADFRLTRKCAIDRGCDRADLG
jgi:hypothetical protein